MKCITSRIAAVFLLFAMILLQTTPLFASNAEEIKQRMIQRKPVIEALKSQGVLGENNSGYLAFRGPSQGKENVVEEENRDRRAVYEAIARQQNTDAALVGARRALQIGEQAASGTWLQAPDGSWHKK